MHANRIDANPTRVQTRCSKQALFSGVVLTHWVSESFHLKHFHLKTMAVSRLHVHNTAEELERNAKLYPVGIKI